jgi:hypothetical protein
MSRFTMRRTWPDEDRHDDFVFRVDGLDAGRCYRMIAAGSRIVWHWTVYGKSTGGMEDTLEEAQAGFKAAIEAESEHGPASRTQ